MYQCQWKDTNRQIEEKEFNEIIIGGIDFSWSKNTSQWNLTAAKISSKKIQKEGTKTINWGIYKSSPG